MTDQTAERRSRRRVPVDVPVKLRKPDGTEQKGLARDLSSAGIFLYSESGLEVGTKLDVVITLPAGVGLGPGGWALCQASVVRVEEATAKGVGVAAVIDRIELLPELT